MSRRRLCPLLLVFGLGLATAPAMKPAPTTPVKKKRAPTALTNKGRTSGTPARKASTPTAPAKQRETSAAPARSRQRSLVEVVLDFLGVTANPDTFRGTTGMTSGDIWVADLEKGVRRPLTENGGYRSPVFVEGDQQITALRGSELVRIPRDGGEAEVVGTLPGVTKLVGVNRKDPQELLFLAADENGRILIERFSLQTHRSTPVPYDPKKDDRMLQHLISWERVYKGIDNGQIHIYVHQADIYLERGENEPRNVSRAGGVPCSQPSLSQDGRFVTYVKQH
jgi:hypothetical protein